MVLSSALMGVSLFLYATITTPAASVGFNAMEYFCTFFSIHSFVFCRRIISDNLDEQSSRHSTPSSTAGRQRHSPLLYVGLRADSRRFGDVCRLLLPRLLPRILATLPACSILLVGASSYAR